MDDDGLFVGLVVNDHDLQQSTRAIPADDEVSAVAPDHTERVANRMVDVLVADAVLARTVRDLHLDKLSLSPAVVKTTLSEPGR